MTYIDPTTGTNFKIQDFFQACVTLTVGEDFWWGSLWFGLCICALMTRQSLWIKLCWTKCPCQIVHECKRIQNELFVMGVNSFTCLLYHFFTIYQRKMVVFPWIWSFWHQVNTLQYFVSLKQAFDTLSNVWPLVQLHIFLRSWVKKDILYVKDSTVIGQSKSWNLYFLQ